MPKHDQDSLRWKEAKDSLPSISEAGMWLGSLMATGAGVDAVIESHISNGDTFAFVSGAAISGFMFIKHLDDKQNRR